ncbi:hypothetical protein LS77_007450 [Helicobacter bilis]|uniref:Uncharacterized protein n=2 Tax=Helicobacter bilis TaxID=37372 RepID=N2BFB2_9HELI|nr:hypothetical protein [Helicobacter bilis]EMZ37189.1 hypothetical protein C826_02186 [Helicobacter bilis WiWa]EMZ37228.1 hypothetical protein C826_02225 [Helicobacter bilis WiWa]TLE03984.1 hypothetical protein LS77_007450 [Helicobacter bilis]TLE04709.1 hypothetical protein LS76_007490 [Helicobacter bilis]
MQIFIPTKIFQWKVSKNEFNSIYKTLHITKEYVIFTDSKVLVKVYCNNSQLECDELNLDFYSLKNLIKVGSKKSGEISFNANIKEHEVEIMYKSDKGIISGKVERFKKYVDYKNIYDKFQYTYKAKLSSEFSKLALFDRFSKMVIEFKDNLITAKIGNARIAKQRENIDSTELKGVTIALQTSKNSMITLDTKKEATWYFKDDINPYGIIQHDLENTIDIVEMPIIK